MLQEEAEAAALADAEKNEPDKAEFQQYRADIAHWINDVLGTDLNEATLLPALQVSRSYFPSHACPVLDSTHTLSSSSSFLFSFFPCSLP